MSRRVVAAVVLLLSFGLGIALGPVVFAALAPGTEPTSAAPATTDGGPTTPVELSTETPRVPTPEATTLTPEQEADRLAGVRTHRVPDAGSGELRVVAGEAEAPDGADVVMTVRVEVERGLDVDDRAFAAFVMSTLNDPRGWGGDGSVAFARTDGEADIRVVLATPATVDEMCAPLATDGRWSCGRYGHAALNADRWVLGADAWSDAGGDLTSYRQYLVNHEVGHLLGNPHEDCPGAGEVAPVMVQQSISVQGCVPNAWPFP